MPEALRSSTEGLPTFRDVLSGPNMPILYSQIKEGGLYKGEPALLYSSDEVNNLAAPFQLTLIGKFLHTRLNMEFIKKGFSTIGFKGEYTIGLLDSLHIIIRFHSPEDYQHCWMHGTWSFKTYTMKILKWTPHFNAAA